MAVNASYQLPKEPPQPTDLQVQNFIVNSEDSLVPSTGDLFNPIGGNTEHGEIGPGIGPDPGDVGGYDWGAAAEYAQDVWDSLEIPPSWGTTIEQLKEQDYLLNLQ